jgi:hypothetical protein
MPPPPVLNFARPGRSEPGLPCDRASDLLPSRAVIRRPATLPRLVEPLRAALLLALVLAFWAAQMHGLHHGLSHLGRAHAAPHIALCSDCLAAADAGAAPTPVVATPILAVAPAETVAAPRLQGAPAGAPAHYRSRAPPPTQA